MQKLFLFVPFFALSTAGLAQPLAAPRGIVNAASFMTPGLPAGSIARGSIFSIFGQRLGPGSSPPLAFPLATSLGGVSIKVIQGNTSVDVIPLFVSLNQINAIMPSTAPLGMVSVQVTFNNARGNMAPVQVVNTSVGIFAVRAGLGPGILFNFVSQDQQPVNSPTVAAMPGQTIVMYATGLGPVSFPDNTSPPGGNLAVQTEVFVGGKAASVQYNGRVPGIAGEDQINFIVPSDAPTGCFVPVTVRTAGTAPSNTVTMAISADGSPCSDPGNPLAQSIINGGKFGAVLLMRTNTHEDLGIITPTDITVDTAIVNMRQESPMMFPFNPLFAYPPAGSCTAYGVKGNLFGSDDLPLTATTGKYLDAGSAMFQLLGPGGNRQVMPSTIAPLNPVLSLWQIGKNIPTSPLSNSALLQQGAYTLNGSGGPDVGSFQATINNPAPLTWTNRDQVTNINRAQQLTINWSGGPNNVPVAIMGANVDLPTNSTSLFVCMAPAGTNSFSVPSYILANVPASRSRHLASRGILYVGAMTLATPGNFSAPGLDLGVTAATTFTARPVTFQ